MNINELKDIIEKAIVAVATIDNENKPHNIAIIYSKIIDNKIVITNNFMKKTIENIKNNSNISLVFWKNERGWRIDGNAEYYDSGKWLEFVKSLKENKDMPVRGAVVINIRKIDKLCG